MTHQEELEKEIGLFTTKSLLKKRNHSTGIFHLTQNDIEEIAKHFCEWQKEQITNNSIGGYVVESSPGILRAKSDPINDNLGFKRGDNIKFILVNE